MIEIKTRRPLLTEPNITPLVDIVFLLLIFFLLSAFFISPEGLGVRLPEAEAPAVPMEDEMVVVVDASGAVFISEAPVSLDQLEREVGRALAADPARPVVIRADRGLVLQRAVEVMDRCQRAGARRLVIATQAPGP